MARTRSTTQRTVAPLILDSGAVIALSRHDLRARAVLAAAREAGAEVIIPAPVVAKTVRGKAGDAPVNRVLKAVGHVVPADEPICRAAAHLLEATQSTETIDAIVVATAASTGGGVVLTSDPRDLNQLAQDQPLVEITSL